MGLEGALPVAGATGMEGVGAVDGVAIARNFFRLSGDDPSGDAAEGSEDSGAEVEPTLKEISSRLITMLPVSEIDEQTPRKKMEERMDGTGAFVNRAFFGS